MTDGDPADTRIAVIGMAGRFPQAADVERFWAACRDGAGCISRWEGREEAGRVLAGGLVADQDLFDPAAFGISPTEAAMLDPQHRVFLEICWEALAQASIAAGRGGAVSVYAAAAPSRYRPEGGDGGSGNGGSENGGSENSRYQRMIANAPDYLATRVSYHLDLCGEAVNVQTACSSSLVAVHLACLSLQSGRSDVALAGGVSIDPAQERGYAYEAGMIASPDGACLPFDAAARGAVPGNGAAVVVLQRLSDAIAERRIIHGVILATATNNDGRRKPSFMAPNVEGQSEAIATALATADVPAETIGYVEAHGTATKLGDAIEIEAARTAFRYFTDRSAFCALGSLKANFGHLDRAAGVAGLIKAICAVRDGVIPPLFGFRAANPDLDLVGSPFRIPLAAEDWRPAGPRRAGVSSFGVGGTNAHVIVEQFDRPAAPDVAAPPGPIALPLSAHNATALAARGRDLAAWLDGAPVSSDVTHTLAAARDDLAARAVTVAMPDAAGGALRDPPPAVFRAPTAGSLAMLFPGQGAEIGYRAATLADRYPVFGQEIDAFADALGVSRDALLDGVGGTRPDYRDFAYQPALVAVQVALARLAEQLGAPADVYCGNSLGEYAAAHMAGVFDRAGLMTVLAERDLAMRAAPEGRMLAVLAGRGDVEPLRLPDIDVAGESWSDRVLLTGATAAIVRQRELLEAHDIRTRELPGRIAPHGRLMTAVADRFRRAFDAVHLNRPARSMVSSLTGQWVDGDAVTDPETWVRHLCEPFRFHHAFETLTNAGVDRFVEASPGLALTKLIRASGTPGTATSLGGEPGADPAAAFLTALGDLWCAGTAVDWDAANGSSDARLVALPPYPFQRARFWSHEASPRRDGASRSTAGLIERPVWRPQPHGPTPPGGAPPRRIVVHGGGAVAAALVARLAAEGIDASRPEDAGRDGDRADILLIDCSRLDLPSDAREPTDDASLRAWLDAGLLGSLDPLRRLRPARLLIATRSLWPVAPGDAPSTAAAGAVGVARCAPHDWPGLTAAIVDLPAIEDIGHDVSALIAEIGSDGDDAAYRRGVRYGRRFEPDATPGIPRLRSGGTYLVLGGTGRLGAVVAQAISIDVDATIILTGRDAQRAAPAGAERLIAAARARGCEIVYRSARSDCRQSLRSLLDDLTARHGRIDGVFHLAANTATATYRLLDETTADSAIDVAQAKVCTAALLAEELTDRDHDFVALFSSISTVIGAARFGSYVAANAYLDALAVRRDERSGRRWFSLVWDGWSADGIAGPAALGFDNGARLLRDALRSDHNVIAPVAQPLARRIEGVCASLAAVADTVAAAAGPAGPIEDRSPASFIARVIADVTGHVDADPQRSFASLGIDSLRLMQIVVRLRPMLGEAAGVGRLLAANSIGELTALAAIMEAAPQAQAPTSDVGEDDLSTPQERLWYLAQLDPGSSAYNVPFGWFVPAPMAAGTGAAVRALIERHALLRAAYREDDDGRPRRIVLSPEDVPIEHIALRPGDPPDRFDRIARAFVEQPLDLATGSTRVLIAAGGDGTRLVFVCHHISIDAWSIKLLREELVRCLSGAPAADAPPTGYSDFVRSERALRDGPHYAELVRYWRDTLRGMRPTLPPADPIATPAGDRLAGRMIAMLPNATLDRLRVVLGGHGATLYVGCLTALSIALGRWCGAGDVVIGTNLANRMREAFEAIVGMFVDPVVLRLAPASGEPAATLATALLNVRERFAAAVAHTGIPYLDIVRLSGQRSDTGDNPLFSIIATMFDADGDPAIAPLDIPLPATAKFALAVEFLPQPDGLMMHVLYDADRYLPATIERMLNDMRRCLERLADGDGDARVADLFDEPRPAPTRERFARRFGRLSDAATGPAG